jgi:hypothetical protein
MKLLLKILGGTVAVLVAATTTFIVVNRVPDRPVD